MGDGLTREKPRQTSATPYGDIFDEAFPHYLVIGMTAEEYWDGESRLKVFYRKAYRIKREQEDRIADRNAWLYGKYMREAIQSVPHFVAGFMKGMTLGEYPELPYLEQAAKKKQEQEKKQAQEDQMKLAMAYFHAGIAKFNANFEKRKAEAKAKAVSSGQ